jgi:hypothetical protein
MTALPKRQVVHDNIGTELAPTWRARYATPLTPRAVRAQIIAQAHDVSEAQREGWIAERMTPLDRMLDDDQSAALEAYVDCERLLAGNARCGDYTGDRVMTSRAGGMSPLPDDRMPELARHSAVKLSLSGPQRNIMAVFVAQQSGALSWTEPQAAIRLGLPGKDKRQAYYMAVMEVSIVLVRNWS